MQDPMHGPTRSPNWSGFLPSGEPASIRVKPMAVSFTIGRETVYTFDLEGRLYGAFVEGGNYRRGLDNSILEKRRVDRQPFNRRVGEGERDRFLARTHTRVQELVNAAAKSDTVAVVRDSLDRMSTWTPDRYADDGRAFKRVYLPISILPPDQYMALVVQATEGCPWNRCTFCDLYRDRPFRIRSFADLRDHIEQVKAFLGDGIRLRRSLFLGDANALTMPWQRLKEAFVVLREAFPSGRQTGPTVDEVHAFTDAFAPGLRSAEEIASLSEWGLRRVTVGLETGHDPLLALVEKQGTSADAVEAVRHLKAGGIRTNVVIMAGLGGERYADAHIDDTVRAVETMELGRGDIVYLSPLVAYSHLPYARMAAAADLRPLRDRAVEDQLAVFRERLSRRGVDGPTVARYDIGRFVY